ncbi:hypothetical protein JCM8097_004035 [Rhodosporidiobolus ruineniae]
MPSVLARIRSRVSIRRAPSSRSAHPPSSASAEPASSPPLPPPSPEQLAALYKLRQELDDENQARALAEQLAQEDLRAELADEALARRLAEEDRAKQEEERLRREEDERRTADEVKRLELEAIEEGLKKQNGVFECPICAEEYYRGELIVACTDGHALCASCATQGSHAALENRDATLTCLAEGGCEGTYLAEEAEKFLDERQMALLEKVRREKNVAILAGDGLLQCPFCPYAAVFEDADDLTTLDCLNPDCAKRTCLSCKHLDHGDTPCALANPSAVHVLEEQMSAAMIRRCGKCKTPFVKNTGCNLITCTTCAAKSCYLCQKLVNDVKYDHFNVVSSPCARSSLSLSSSPALQSAYESERLGYKLLFDDKTVAAGVETVRQRGMGALQTAEERAHAQRLRN